MSRKSRNLSSTPLRTRDASAVARASKARRFEHLTNDDRMFSNFTDAERRLNTNFRLYDAEKRYLPLRLNDVEDKRTIPHEIRPESRPRNLNGTVARYRRDEVLYHRVRGMSVQMRPKFLDPRQVITCIRRSIRKRVIFALQKAGSGGGRQRPPRWTEDSYIRCH